MLEALLGLRSTDACGGKESRLDNEGIASEDLEE